MVKIKKTNKMKRESILVLTLLIGVSFLFSNIQSDSLILTGNMVGTNSAPDGGDNIGEVRIYEVTFIDKKGMLQDKIKFDENGTPIGTGKPDANTKGKWFADCSTLTNKLTRITSLGSGKTQKAAEADCHKSLKLQKKTVDKIEAKDKNS
ncbi:hypothetical protein HN992_01405 [Candidatus Woesearchaeota archaeon]|nr:hypothetical protein [Candidatus Woesearchaeota archaeon]